MPPPPVASTAETPQLTCDMRGAGYRLVGDVAAGGKMVAIATEFPARELAKGGPSPARRSWDGKTSMPIGYSGRL